MARSDIATESHNTNGAQCAEEFRDGCRRLYRPVFDPERQRAVDRMPAVGGRCRHPAQSSRSQGRQDRGRPLPAQHDERQGPGDAGFRSGSDVPAALLARDHGLGRRRACANRWSSTSPISTGPAHYLRVSILFDSPFWGDKIPGAWFMSEAFGGCCVYNEGARHDVGRHGVLNWLIAGSDALAFANLGDQELIDAALKSLPASLRRRARALHRGQDPSLAVVGQRVARRHAGARCHDQSPAGPEAASRPGRGRRLSVRFDAERPARFLRCRHRHHRHRNDAAAPRARRGRPSRCRTRSIATISRTTAGLARIARSGASSPIPPT